MPFLTKSFPLRRSSEAIITTDVVPSPTSWSCKLARSTRTRAAGCSTSNDFKMVAPSFVMRTSPISSTSILSRPTGPRDDFTMLATANAAVTLPILTSWPVSLCPLMNSPVLAGLLMVAVLIFVRLKKWESIGQNCGKVGGKNPTGQCSVCRKDGDVLQPPMDRAVLGDKNIQLL